jgi:hypothetical protein
MSVGSPRLHPRWLNVLLVIAASAIATQVALVWSPAVFLDSGIVPTGHDSFYHAARILAAVQSSDGVWAGLAQFDGKIHAPEGSWVTWPWAYDGLMAAIVHLLGTVGISPLPALMYVPTILVTANIALVFVIAKCLRLPTALCATAALCQALSPLTQELHGLGRLDHHYVEQLATLWCLWLGLQWFNRPSSPRWAGMLGLSLGFANALYNGLFILAAPVLVTFVIVWWREGRLSAWISPYALVAWACGSLVGVVFAVAPSGPFQAGLSAYYWLSWFHIHVVSAGVLFALVMYRTSRSAASTLGLLGLVAVVLAPMFYDLVAGVELVAGAIHGLSEMTDVASPLANLWANPRAAFEVYSGAIVLLPVTLVWLAGRLARGGDHDERYFAAVCLCGISLFLMQHRFHQYAGFSLYLVPLVAAHRAILRWGLVQQASRFAREFTLGAALVLALIAAYWPVARIQYSYPVPGFSIAYELTRTGYATLASACAEMPGVVLSDPESGHYIRFHSTCGVIANNFLTTAQHLQKIALSQALIDGTVANLKQRAPWVRYVWLVRQDNVLDRSLTPAAARAANPGLRTLLFDNPNSNELELLWSGPSIDSPHSIGVVARLYRVIP